MGECESGPDGMGLSTQDRIDGSLRSYVCGMRNCDVPPEIRCPSCELWYCQNDWKRHFAGYPDHREGKPIK